jgi:hypothetical protein
LYWDLLGRKNRRISRGHKAAACTAPMHQAHSSESARPIYCGWTCISHLTLTSGLVSRHTPSPNDLPPPLLSPKLQGVARASEPESASNCDRPHRRQAKARSAPLPAARRHLAEWLAGTQRELWVAPLPCQVRTPSLQCEVPCRIARSSIGHRGRL